MCDLNNALLVPDKVTNLLNFASQAEIEASQDLAAALTNGLVQIGKWKISTFAVTQYNKQPDRTDLDNVATATMETISGYPTTCSEQIPIEVTTRLQLDKAPLSDPDAANKKYVDDTVDHAHDGNINIGRDLTVQGDAEIIGNLTAPNIITSQITGMADSTGQCQLDVNCKINVQDISFSDSSKWVEGSGVAQMGANCPANTLTTPDSWLEVKKSDGTIVYIPAWK